MDAANIYDTLAPNYRSVSARKLRYLRSVDSLVVRNCPLISARFLDVGCGDGVRTAAIAGAANAVAVDVIDVSPEMVKRAKKRFAGARCIAIKDYKTSHKYNVITALWNVFGHIPEKDRTASLERIRELLADGGRFILDVNNRYNIGYGLINVVRNFIFRRPGWFSFKFRGRGFPVYLYTPAEIKRLLRDAGFRVVRSYGVNYDTGRVSGNLLRGQIVLVCEKA